MGFCKSYNNRVALLECLNAWMLECHFYPFLKKRWHGVLYLVVFNQWLMVLLFDEMFYLIDAFYFAMCFILIYSKLYLNDVFYLNLFKALFNSKLYLIQSFI